MLLFTRGQHTNTESQSVEVHCTTYCTTLVLSFNTSNRINTFHNYLFGKYTFDVMAVIGLLFLYNINIVLQYGDL